MNIIGSKGCFRKGSLVQLENGITKAIEDIKVGDEVLSFNETGELFVSKVTETHFHKDPEPLIRVRFWNGSIDITPNHWVLNQYGNFIDIGSLTEKDALIDSMGHLRPIISAEIINPEAVYNLTVEPNHTFICNNIRVHNGGYAARYPVVGSKGGDKGGGGSRPAVEAPDSLRSIAYAKVVDLLAEGEIEGLTNGPKSIYLNEVPLCNQDGTFNFSGFTWAARNGTQDQTYIEGFNNVESAREVNVRIKGYTPPNGGLPAVAAEPVERAYSNTNNELDGVRLTIGVPALYVQDTTTGDVNGTSVQLIVYANHNNSGWYEAPINSIWKTIQTYTTPTTYITTNFVTATSIYLNASFDFDRTWVPNNYWEWELGGIAGSYEYSDINYNIEFSSNNGTSWTSIKSGIISWSASLIGAFNRDSNTLSGVNYLGIETPNNYTTSIEVVSPISASSSKAFRITTSGGRCIAYTLYSVDYDGKINISGKASSRYQRSIFVPFNQPGSWQIRIARTTEESIKGSLVNQTWLDLETEVTYGKFRYPNSALVGINIDSSQFDNIPSRAYDVKLLKIKIPSNYNPNSRTYTGEWDGTFKIAWSNNPAWCLYDLITNDRYGLGQYVDTSLVDKWSLYTIAKYCDELVPTSLGTGLTEPRFTCNMYIQSREDAFKVLNDMTSIFRGMLYWASGSITAIQDSPIDPSHLFTNANVVDGLFTYSGASEKARHTVALVTWNDMNDMCRQKVEYVEDIEGVKTHGIVETSLIAVGCTSRGQAHRIGRWLLYSEKYEADLVSFKTGLEGATAKPGCVIKIADQARGGDRFGGRIVSVINTNTIELDKVPDTSLVGYTFSTFKIDGSIQESIILGINSNTITLSTPLPELPSVDTIWVASSNSGVSAQLFRVLSIIENSPAEFEISAIKHEPAKYAYIEKDLKLPLRTFSNLSTNPKTPTNLYLKEDIYSISGSIKIKLSASWTPVSFANSYKIIYARNGDNASTTRIINVPYIDLDDVPIGTYTVSVWAINSIGNLSLTPAVQELVVYGKTLAPEQVYNFNKTISGNKLLLSWAPDNSIDTWGYEVRDIDSGWGQNTNYLYNGTELSCLVNPALPTQSKTFYIKTIDTSGIYSGIKLAVTSATYDNVNKIITLQFSNQSYIPYLVGTKVIVRNFVPYAYNGTFTVTEASTNYIKYSINIPTNEQGGVGNYGYILTHSEHSKTSTSTSVTFQTASIPNIYEPSIVVDLQENSTTASSLFIKWDPVLPEFGLSHYKFTNGTEAPVILTSPSITLPITWTADRTINIKVVDGIGNESSGTNKTINITVPGNVTSPTYTLSKVSGEVVMNMTWAPSTKGSLTIAGYEVRSTNANWGTSSYIYKGNANSCVIPGIIGNLGQTWYIKAFDTNSNYSTSATSILLDDLVPPINVTGFNYSTSVKGLKLYWTESASLDVVAYEIRKSDTGWGTNNVDRVYYGSITEAIITNIVLGNYTYYIRARDVSGIYSTTSQTLNFNYVSPAVVDTINYDFQDDQITNASIKLYWTDPSPQFGTKAYRVSYEGINIIQDSNSIVVPANWVGSRSYSVYVIDNNNIESTATTLNLTKYRPTQVGNVQQSIAGTNVVLKWPTNTFISNSGYLPIAGYEIRHEDAGWGSAGFIFKANANEAVLVPNQSSSTLWYLRAFDTDNEYSEASRVITFNRASVPNVSNISYSYFDTSSTSATITLNWTNASTPEFGLKHYRINFNGIDKTTSSNTITLPADWIGERTFTIYTVDNWGYESTGINIIAVKSKPNPPTGFYLQVIDNTVMLTWTPAANTSLPISHYRVKSGPAATATWDNAEDLGRKDGAFTTISELQSGTYKYFICSVDTDNVESNPIDRTCEVAEPPDFVFHNHLFAQYGQPGAEAYSINVTYTSAKYDPYNGGGSVVLPVNTTETYQDHFTARSWTQPQNQVNAGYPVFITPAPSSGSYQETFDTGTLLASSKIILSASSIGDLTIVPTIEVSTNNSTWTSYPGTWEIFAVNFRYIRITLTVNTSDYSKVNRIYDINVLLNAKQISDSGTTTCASGDTLGTIVNFNKEFIDVTSISTSPSGNTALMTVYDYKDTVYECTYSITSNICTVTKTAHGLITGQNVKLYFSSGTGISGLYTITGYTTNTFTVAITTSNGSGSCLTYPQSMRIYLFNNSGTRQSGDVSWFIKGY